MYILLYSGSSRSGLGFERAANPKELGGGERAFLSGSQTASCANDEII